MPSFKFNQHYWPVNKLLFLLVALNFFLATVISISAQPTGKPIVIYPDWEQEEKELSKKIAEAEPDGQFLNQYYVERSKLYINVANDSFGHGGVYSRGEMVLPAEDLYKRAIADLTRSIKLDSDPTASYMRRAAAHFEYWRASLNGFNMVGDGRFYNAKFFKNKKVLDNLPAAYKMVEMHFEDALADYHSALRKAEKNPQPAHRFEHLAKIYCNLGELYSDRYFTLENRLASLNQRLSYGGGQKLMAQEVIFNKVYSKEVLEATVDQAIINLTKAAEPTKREGFDDFKNYYSFRISDDLEINRYRKAQFAIEKSDYDTAIEMLSANLTAIKRILIGFKAIDTIDYRRIEKYAAFLGERGEAWLAKKNYEQALQDFNEGIENSNRCLKCLGGRIKICDMRGEFEKALADYQEYIYLLPRNKELESAVKQSQDKMLNLAANLAKAYEQKSEFQHAIEKWTVVIEKSGYDEDRRKLRRQAYEKRAELLRKLGKVEEAVRDEETIKAEEKITQVAQLN